MYSSAFYSAGLQVYNLKSPNLSLDEVYSPAEILVPLVIPVATCLPDGLTAVYLNGFSIQVCLIVYLHLCYKSVTIALI
jgi:hypothetical protein